MNAKIIIDFNNADGNISLINNKGINTIAKIRNNIVEFDTTDRELALRVGIFIQHLGIDIQRLVETS